ncbi:MAG: c-type cytochrome [Gemmatimonadota bacterium]
MTPKSRDQVMGHADEADGIEEYDNPLPDWWVGMFIFTIIWAVAYAGWYHFIAHNSPQRALAAEMTDARKRWPETGIEAHVVMSSQAIERGEVVFKANCTACHGADMKGGIGPNLLDEVWIHGGKAEEIVHTITTGVSAKGMPTWGPVLGPEKIGQVAAYILSRNHATLGIADVAPTSH